MIFGLAFVFDLNCCHASQRKSLGRTTCHRRRSSLFVLLRWEFSPDHFSDTPGAGPSNPGPKRACTHCRSRLGPGFDGTAPGLSEKWSGENSQRSSKKRLDLLLWQVFLPRLFFWEAWQQLRSKTKAKPNIIFIYLFIYVISTLFRHDVQDMFNSFETYIYK